MRDPSVPPFRIEPYGPGLEVVSEGQKYEFWDGSELAGKVRVSSNSVRIYDANAALLGRLAQRADGWDLVLADGTELCVVSESAGSARVDCETLIVTLDGEDQRLIISIGDEPFVRIVEGEGWRTETPDEPEAFGRWSDGEALSIQTHPDAWAHRDVRPTWLAPAVIAWSLDFPELELTEDRLLGGTLAYLIARRLSGEEAVGADSGPPEGSAQSSSESDPPSGP